MLSLDLFNSQFEKKLHEGAVDDAEYARLKKLGEKIDYLKQARAKTTDPEMRRAIDGRIKEYDDERMEILSVRGMKEAEQQPAPAKGLLKGKDLITPQQRVAGATPAKPGVVGAVKDVVGGIKRFVKGEPDQGPTYEQQEPGSSPRALGIANFQRLVKANAGFQPTVYFEFIRPEENFKLDQRGIDLISDYYDGLANDQAKNYFIYRILPSGDETLKVLKQLGWTPSTPVQQELPGMPQQGELPLSEKKKNEAEPELKAGDVKVARELQKLRAQYPAARSDVEAVARAEIDSTERSQRQLAAIRGANEKQDALLKQLVALDREQGREIDTLDQENNSLEKDLAKIQATNDRLQQTIGQMTGTKKTTRSVAPTAQSIDLIPGAPADSTKTVKAEPAPEPAPQPKTVQATSPAMAAMAKQIQGLSQPAPTIRPAAGLKAANEPQAQAVAEHGGGIGPRKHWQDLMQEQGRPPMDTINYYFPDINAQSDVEAIRAAIRQIVNNPELSKTSKQRLLGQIGMMVQRNRALIGREWRQYLDRFSESDEHLIEGIKDTASATAVIACLLTGGSLQGCANSPQQTSAQQVLKTGQDIGRTVQSAKKITRAGTEAEVNQEIRNIMRGISGRPEEFNNSNILRIWKRIKGQPPVTPEPQAPEYGPAEPVRRPATEAKEINTKEDFVKERDRLLRMISQETNPANKQILKSAIRQLENRAENEGWIALQQRMIREDNASDAAEQAILKRIMVAHTDLLKQFGPQKVMQAAEEVAYNVGDVAEIGSSDVSGWVKQVEQILGATP